MGVTNYMTVNGKIRSEQRSGEAHSRDYVLDRLGSVIQIYQNGWPIADACYEPYGGIYTQWNMEGKTFTWLGGWGYRQTGVEWSSVYVRARHYSRGLSNWTSVDPLWPSEMAYGYVEGRVMTGVDYWGMQVAGMDSFRQWGNRVFPPNRGIPSLGIPDPTTGAPVGTTPGSSSSLRWPKCEDMIFRFGPIVRKVKCIGVWPQCFCFPIPGGTGGGVWPPGTSGGTTYGLPSATNGLPDIYWYGNYCGANNVVPRKCQSHPNNAPIDCVDRACQEHDNCLDRCKSQGFTAYAGNCQAKCHCQLYWKTHVCGSFGGCLSSLDPIKIANCLEASVTVGSVFGPICAGTTLIGLGIK